MTEGQHDPNWHDSRTWTGLYHERPRMVRLSKSRAAKLWWTVTIGLKKTLCPHNWNWARVTCDVCGLTAEEFEDHSWRWPSKRGWVAF